MKKAFLAPLNSSDTDLVYKLFNEPLVYNFGFLSYYYPQSDIQIKKMVERWLTTYDQKHFVIDSDNNEKVGIAQLYNIDNVNRKCELGILILPDKSNQGLGTIILNNLINICFSHINLHKIEVKIMEENEISINLFRKCGFIEEGILKDSIFHKGQFKNVHLFGLTNSKNN